MPTSGNPTAQTHERKIISVGQGGCVPVTQTHTLTVVVFKLYYSAYLVYMSVDACQMEILFSLCVVVFSLIVMIILWPYSCWLCHHYQRSLFFFFSFYGNPD